jgi:hypothetical protein
MLSDNMEPGPKIDRMGDPLIAIRYGNVSITGFNVARAYDKRVENFSRFWMLCGSHALFIVDMINTVAPALVRWNFLLNNRDGKLEFKSAAKDRIVARRGNAGMKLFHNAVDEKQKFSQSLAYSYVHDAYHPLPGHFSEGGSGSGYLVRFTENESFTGERVAVNAIAVDRYGAVASWHFKREGHSFILEGPNATESWKLNISDNYSMLIEALHEESKIDIFRENEQWITKKD